MYYPTMARFTAVDPLAEFFPGINSYSYAVNNPVLFNDRFGLFPSLANGANQIAICPTCPDGEEFDIYRDNDALFTYLDGIVVNGDGSGPTVTARRNASATVWPWDMAITSASFPIAKGLNKANELDGIRNTMSSVFSNTEIERKVLHSKPWVKSRPVKVLSQYTLPRNVVTKVAKGLQVDGGLTALYTTGDAIARWRNNMITGEHAAVTSAIALGVVGIGMVATAPVSLTVGAAAILYSIYEDDIWQEYDQNNVIDTPD